MSENLQLEQNDLFDILSSARRRYVLYLLDENGEMKLMDLAEHVAAWENEIDREAVTNDQRKRVYVSLYQTHVPRLEEFGLVEYEAENGSVSPAESANTIRPYLTTEGFSAVWQYLYPPLIVVSLLVAGLSASNVSLFASVGIGELAVVLGSALAVTVSIHLVIVLSRRYATPPEFQ